MSEIIDATYKFLDELDKSKLIENLTKYKNRLLQDKQILSKIKQTKKTTDNSMLIMMRKELYSNKNYQMYMKYYNELSFIILKINKQYKKYTSTREHNCI